MPLSPESECSKLCLKKVQWEEEGQSINTAQISEIAKLISNFKNSYSKVQVLEKAFQSLEIDFQRLYFWTIQPSLKTEKQFLKDFKYCFL